MNSKFNQSVGPIVNPVNIPQIGSTQFNRSSNQKENISPYHQRSTFKQPAHLKTKSLSTSIIVTNEALAPIQSNRNQQALPPKLSHDEIRKIPFHIPHPQFENEFQQQKMVSEQSEESQNESATFNVHGKTVNTIDSNQSQKINVVERIAYLMEQAGIPLKESPKKRTEKPSGQFEIHQHKRSNSNQPEEFTNRINQQPKLIAPQKSSVNDQKSTNRLKSSAGSFEITKGGWLLKGKTADEIIRQTEPSLNKDAPPEQSINQGIQKSNPYQYIIEQVPQQKQVRCEVDLSQVEKLMQRNLSSENQIFSQNNENNIIIRSNSQKQESVPQNHQSESSSKCDLQSESSLRKCQCGDQMKNSLTLELKLISSDQEIANLRSQIQLREDNIKILEQQISKLTITLETQKQYNEQQLDYQQRMHQKCLRQILKQNNTLKQSNAVQNSEIIQELNENSKRIGNQVQILCEVFQNCNKLTSQIFGDDEIDNSFGKKQKTNNDRPEQDPILQNLPNFIKLPQNIQNCVNKVAALIQQSNDSD